MITLFILKILNKIIPVRVLYIKTKCKLDGCNDSLVSCVMTGKTFFTDTELFDVIFKTHGKHLVKKHKIDSFVGLEFKSVGYKYTLLGAYAEDTKQSDRFTRKERN